VSLLIVLSIAGCHPRDSFPDSGASDAGEEAEAGDTGGGCDASVPDGSVVECSTCSPCQPCAAGGVCRNSTFPGGGFCVRSLPACSTTAPLPQKLTVDHYFVFGCGSSPQALVCHFEHMIDFSLQRITLEFRAEGTPDGGDFTRDAGSMLMSPELLSTWESAAADLSCFKGLSPYHETCAFHAPSVLVTVPGDGGFEYALGFGAYPPEPIVRAVDGLFSVSVAIWRDGGFN
jgi:hypothetical protein